MQIVSPFGIFWCPTSAQWIARIGTAVDTINPNTPAEAAWRGELHRRLEPGAGWRPGLIGMQYLKPLTDRGRSLQPQKDCRESGRGLSGSCVAHPNYFRALLFLSLKLSHSRLLAEHILRSHHPPNIIISPIFTLYTHINDTHDDCTQGVYPRINIPPTIINVMRMPPYDVYPYYNSYFPENHTR